MTHTFLREFEDRKRQVRHYLAVVSRAEREAGIGPSRLQEGRLLTLRAGTFLILYNMIEASTRASMEAIHDKITTSATPFPSLCVQLRKEIVRLFKRGADPSSHHTMNDFSSGFVAVALTEEVKLSGNVDAKAIRELGACYGFSCQTDKRITRDGVDLLTIKRNRNDLAHGLRSFEEIGRDHATPELLLLARRAMRYMDGILNNVAAYLDGQQYLENPPAAPQGQPLLAAAPVVPNVPENGPPNGSA